MNTFRCHDCGKDTPLTERRPGREFVPSPLGPRAGRRLVDVGRCPACDRNATGRRLGGMFAVSLVVGVLTCCVEWLATWFH